MRTRTKVTPESLNRSIRGEDIKLGVHPLRPRWEVGLGGNDEDDVGGNNDQGVAVSGER